jgi:hypothetical protein
MQITIIVLMMLYYHCFFVLLLPNLGCELCVCVCVCVCVLLEFELRAYTSPLFVLGFLKIGLTNYLSGLVLNCKPSDLCLLSSWDYRCKPLAPG